ncbi:MAG TPA: hypothetical protein VJ553_02990 [Candidatus Paceibacterota bacterium]|nr:hypothetical protein [Candidatus Paceibacterota bacterium]
MRWVASFLSVGGFVLAFLFFDLARMGMTNPFDEPWFVSWGFDVAAATVSLLVGFLCLIMSRASGPGGTRRKRHA